VRDGVHVYLGSYGPNVPVARQVADLPNGRYAPMFALNEPYYRQKRHLPPEQAPLVPKRLAGQVPPLNQLGSTSVRVSWGVELGARYRDAIRAAADTGAQVDSWLLLGRPVLGDTALRGFVWVAHSALSIARLRITPELTTFWRTLSSAALAYVGEEYAPFDGDPRSVARAYASGQRALAAGGAVRRSLARRYVPGMTPGYHLAPSLGGNIHHWRRPRVNAWRATYVQERARSGVAGFAEFDFRFENSAPTVMHDVLSALAAEV
jgi:hypothetical protein